MTDFEERLKKCEKSILVTTEESGKYADLLKKYHYYMPRIQPMMEGYVQYDLAPPVGGSWASLPPQARQDKVSGCITQSGFPVDIEEYCAVRSACVKCPEGSLPKPAEMTKESFKAKYCAEGQVVSSVGPPFKITKAYGPEPVCWKCETPAVVDYKGEGKPPDKDDVDAHKGSFKNCEPCDWWCSIKHGFKKMVRWKNYIKVVKPDTKEICDYVGSGGPVKAQKLEAPLPPFMEIPGQVGIATHYVNPIYGYGFPNLPAARKFSAEPKSEEEKKIEENKKLYTYIFLQTGILVLAGLTVYFITINHKKHSKKKR